MATTLVVALVLNSKLWVANVGDSRAYLVRDGHAQQVSRDHSLVAERVRAGMITPEEAERSPQRSVITRSVGGPDKPKVDLFEVGSVIPGDAVVLCSDGLYQMVPEGVIAECVSSLEPRPAVIELIRQANESGGDDNIAVAVARIVAPGKGPDRGDGGAG